MSTVRVLTHAAAVQGACLHFLQRGTVDMDVLARELAVSRATLYRLVRSRDDLLGAVLVTLGVHAVDLVLVDQYPAGVDGVIEVSRRFTDLVADADVLRHFATQEPAVAERILLATTGRVHGRTVQVQRELFVRIAGRGDDVPVPRRRGTDVPVPRRTGSSVPVPRSPGPGGDPLTDRAFLYVRLLESVLYGPVLAGRHTRFSQVEPALRALLT